MAAPSANKRIIVVTGGDPVSPAHLVDAPAGALVIAADSGIDHALAIGLTVDVAVGDFDSVAIGTLPRLSVTSTEIERHPEAKDETDLELALDAAMARGARQVFVLGGHGGRADHFLANALLLASERYASVELVAQMGDARVTVIRQEATLRGQPAALVTLLAVHGSVEGVTTTGLRYPLVGDALAAGSTRGVSNQLVGTEATVSLRAGTLLAIQPHHIPTDPGGTSSR